jgi:L-malate glycosyltransferase
MSPTQPLSIGVTCFPTFGGSGIIATEIGLSLAKRGHRVHFICAEAPWRFEGYVDNVFFHEVQARDYPLFDRSPYALALTSKMVEVATWHSLDVLHVHYAIPHAASAFFARSILGTQAPALVTTLHGTDITVVGNDPSFLPVTRFSIEHSDIVTTPSHSLRRSTYENLGLSPEVAIDVISNFVDTQTYQPLARPARGRRLLVHSSNFRPVKRVDEVVRVFHAVQQRVPCELVLIGDGPERSKVERLVHQLNLTSSVRFLGKQLHFAQVLAEADVFVLPSETESFGLAALEALASGVPVVASDVGGLPEVVRHEETGFLVAFGDTQRMTEAIVRLLEDRALHQRFSLAARADALRRFERERIVDEFEACYRRSIERRQHMKSSEV